MNEKLRQARRERNWSQEEAAAQCKVSRTTYMRWEHEGQTPHGYNLTEACLAFNMAAYQLGFGHSSFQTSQQNRAQVREQEDAHAVLLARREDHTAQYVTQQDGGSTEPIRLPRSREVRLTHEQMEVLLSFVGGHMAHFDEAKRNTLLMLLRGAGVIIIGSEFGGLEGGDERLAYALKKPGSLDRATLFGLKYAIQSYWLIRVHGSIATPILLQTVVGHYRTITQLLQGSLVPTTRTSLSAIASETALLAGMLLSTDMQKHDEALSYYSTALVVAQQANNDALYAAGLGRMSSLAASLGKPREARSLLQEGQRLVMHGDAFTMRAWLSAEEAEVQALIAAQENQHQTSASFKALEKAEELTDHIGSEEETFGMYFDHARIPAYRGSCNLRLHRPEEAIKALNEALEPLDPFGALTRAVQLDLAEAHIQAGDVYQACQAIKHALANIIPTQATSSLQRVRTLRQQLKPWSTTQAVREVDDLLRG